MHHSTSIAEAADKILVITSIELKSPLKLLTFYRLAFNVIKQIRASNCIAYKTRGSWTIHYTISLWRNDRDIKDFAGSNEHFYAMQQSGTIAREIKTLRVSGEKMLSWRDAKALLSGRGKSIRF